MKPTQCKSCNAPIIFARTEYGNLIPLDAEPDALKGNIALVDGIAKIVQRGELFEVVHPGPFYLSHYATCPQAAQHRTSARK